MLAGRMMDFPLTITHLLTRVRAFFPRTEVISRRVDHTIDRTTYLHVHRRACQLARALDRLGLRAGDRVATLCWNHQRHLEAYLAIPASGRVIHTLNLRLHPDEIAYIARHAEDRAVIVDRSLLPLFEKIRHQVPSIEHVIVIGDDGPVHTGASPRALRASDSTKRDLDYDALLDAEEDEYAWPDLDERSAAMICYTSGTTGNPKGVVYSHRSTVLHTLAVSTRDSLGIGEADVVLPVVPMFHAAAWGFPYAAVLAGASLVFPGPHLDPASILELMATEKVTFAAGVPTIWIGILALLDAEPKRWDLSSMRAMAIGGSAAPASMIDGFRVRHGLEVIHAWGMTETNPVGTVARVKTAMSRRDRRVRDTIDDEVRLHVRASQGYALPFVEQRHVDEGGKILPWDGHTMGELEVRGPWVASSYVGDEGKDRWTADGWFKTGDVVTIDEEGYVRITDRAKDVIKSGGEWISSVALENALMSHPAILEAAVFAARHPKWAERPVAAIVFKEGKSATPDELRAHLDGKFAKFWLPDDYVFVAQIPRTSTGKFLKSKLREEYGDRLVRAPSTPT